MAIYHNVALISIYRYVWWAKWLFVLKYVASMWIYCYKCRLMALYTWVSFKCRFIAISVWRIGIFPYVALMSI